MARPKTFPAYEAIHQLLKRVLPGQSKRVKVLRRQVLEFCSNLSAKTLLLRGPIGSGKSTLARAISFIRRVAPLSQAAAEDWIKQRVRYDGPGRVDFRLMDWYVEQSLTGLVESLAEGQLFGVAKRAATDVGERPGVFELATTGRSRDKNDRTVGAMATGGVVFLDEIGDLSLALQAKLLPVLSGGVFYRIGGEGSREYEQQFRGVTIVASWRRLDDGLLRADLLSRITTHVIDVPDMNERTEDLPELIDSLEQDLIARYKEEVEELCRSDPKVDREYWSRHYENCPVLSDAEKRLLASIDWGRYGNLRGLSNAIERVVFGLQNPEQVVRGLQPIQETLTSDSSNPRTLLTRLLNRRPDGTGLASHIQEIQREERRALRELLQTDSGALTSLGRALAIEDRKLVYQAQQLDRSRRTRGGGAP